MPLVLSKTSASMASSTRSGRPSTIHGNSSALPARAARGMIVPRAFANGFPNSWNEDAMQDILQDMAQQWQQQQGGRSSSPFNQSPQGGINININPGWGGGWSAPGSRPASSSSNRTGPANSSSSNSNSSSRQRAPLTLTLDVVTSANTYEVYADIPGVSKADLNIKLSKERRVLTISGRRATPVDQGYHQQQRPFGAFEREWVLPADADVAGVKAKVSEGVLRLTVGRVKKQEGGAEGRPAWQDIFIS